jgi:cysteine desulfurase
MDSYLFFDSASTTRCCDAAVEKLQLFANRDYGNPSSSHAFGQKSARAIWGARVFFANLFKVNTEQVIFTGSGSESDNLAIYGTVMAKLTRQLDANPRRTLRVIASPFEHPAVRKCVQSLAAFGVDVQFAPVDRTGQIQMDKLLDLVTSETVLVSMMRVNNITGAILPVEKIAQQVKEKNPDVVFHCDAVQAFGRIDTPSFPSSVDLLSISAHKIEGPKGIGALIVLNKKLLQSGNLRPLVWGGEQEHGLRSGTQNAGLIAGFHAAAEQVLQKKESNFRHYVTLRNEFEKRLRSAGLLGDSSQGPVTWNSPPDAAPYIVSLSVPGFPSGPLAKLLEDRRCLISTGSACSSQKVEPDVALSAMGFTAPVCNSAIRVSFSPSLKTDDVQVLVDALQQSIKHMGLLLGGKAPS